MSAQVLTLAPKWGDHMVTWGETSIPWDEAQRRAQRAQALAKGFKLTTIERRQAFGEHYHHTVVDFFELARLIDKAKGIQQ
ncbi:hypothetical protein SRS16CHR_02586 [Variovorax sp. SRS16]|uniref:hypothetical protein n=1 Tax=Variovorax sp. SRS16 TaxID=282217 RepID=UPI0013174BE1|nr:hypothetical protein [Variovorax sp. SRS16]VTU20157.1 hypothetical protein SRS16CHR_02586 [Variovorax sp. SRS16]